MVKFKVSESGSKLQIAVEQLGDDQHAALKALQECAEGRCTCPTPQYSKMQSIDVVPGAGRVDITLTPKAGESIDRQEIDKCLEYTAEQVKSRE